MLGSPLELTRLALRPSLRLILGLKGSISRVSFRIVPFFSFSACIVHLSNAADHPISPRLLDIHRMQAPFQPNLHDPADTRHFDDDIPNEPLAPAGGGDADATKDPMIKHRLHGVNALALRKKNAFAGFTFVPFLPSHLALRASSPFR